MCREHSGDVALCLVKDGISTARLGRSAADRTRGALAPAFLSPSDRPLRAGGALPVATCLRFPHVNGRTVITCSALTRVLAHTSPDVRHYAHFPLTLGIGHSLASWFGQKRLTTNAQLNDPDGGARSQSIRSHLYTGLCALRAILSPNSGPPNDVRRLLCGQHPARSLRVAGQRCGFATAFRRC
jgi:hypothetical protein